VKTIRSFILDKFRLSTFSQFNPSYKTKINLNIDDNKFKITTVIPVCSRLEYFEDAVKSAVNAASDLEWVEIIIIDNSNNLKSEQIQIIAKRYPQVRYLKSDCYRTMFSNWNYCIEKSKGEYVHILHDDDLIAPKFYKEFEYNEKKLPGVNFFIRSFLIDSEGEIDSLSDRIKDWEKVSEDPTPILYNNKIYAPGAILNKLFIIANGGFRDTFEHSADWDMWLRCAIKGKVYFINKPLTFYRITNSSTTINNMKSGAAFRDVIRHYSHLSKESVIFDKLRYLNEYIQHAENLITHFHAHNEVDGVCNIKKVKDELVYLKKNA